MEIVARGYAQLGVFDEAERTAEESLRLHRRLDGDASARVANDLAFIGRIRLMHGETDSAEARFSEALAMRRSLLGERHSDVGASWADFAEISSIRGDLWKTEELLRRAIGIQRSSDAPEARDRLAHALATLAPIVERTGQAAESFAALNEAIAIAEATHGRRDPSVANYLSARAVLSLNQHDIMSGERDCREALDIRIAALGADHSLTSQSRQLIAQIMVFRGQTDEAERLERLATDAARRSFGPNSPAYANSLGKLAELLVMIDRNDEAQAAFNEALGILQRAGSSQHASARTLRVELMDLWRENLEFERALPVALQQLDEDETLTTIDDVERDSVLISGTEICALAAWNRVSRTPTAPAAAEAPALAARAIELGRRIVERTAKFDGYRRYYPHLHASAALMAHVFAVWAETPDRLDRDAAIGELREAERLLALGYDEARSNNEVLPAPKSSSLSIEMFESWTTRLYWLWFQIAPDERVASELQRWRATGGGRVASFPKWSNSVPPANVNSSNVNTSGDHGDSVESP